MQKVSENCIRKLENSGFELIGGDGLVNVEEINMKASFDVLKFELPKRFEEYCYKHGISMSFEELIPKMGSPEVQRIFSDIFKNPVR